MKVLVFGQEKEKIQKLVEESGLEVVEKDPEAVISYGGDGTVMRSEYEFPGIPKVILRGSHVCKLCSNLPNGEVLKRVKEGKYSTLEIPKLKAEAGGNTIFGLNDIVIHNKDARHALRYTIKINGVPIQEEIIGDGIVVATPFGSTGYYRSITDSFFEVGIGLAFNNSTEQADHVVLRDDSEIRIDILRGPAVVYADNQEETVELQEGEYATVEKSGEIAKIIIAS